MRSFPVPPEDQKYFRHVENYQAWLRRRIVANKRSGKYYRPADPSYRRACKQRYIEFFPTEDLAIAVGYVPATAAQARAIVRPRIATAQDESISMSQNRTVYLRLTTALRTKPISRLMLRFVSSRFLRPVFGRTIALTTVFVGLALESLDVFCEETGNRRRSWAVSPEEMSACLRLVNLATQIANSGSE